MASPSTIATASLTFNSMEYSMKSLPCDIGKSADTIDVTTLEDTRKRFVPAGLVKNDEISVVIAGNTLPTINTTGTLSFTLGSSTVNVGTAIVKSVTPAEITTDSRELTATVVFQPAGSVAAS